jgi:hypothetical protein
MAGPGRRKGIPTAQLLPPPCICPAGGAPPSLHPHWPPPDSSGRAPSRFILQNPLAVSSPEHLQERMRWSPSPPPVAGWRLAGAPASEDAPDPFSSTGRRVEASRSTCRQGRGGAPPGNDAAEHVLAAGAASVRERLHGSLWSDLGGSAVRRHEAGVPSPTRCRGGAPDMAGRRPPQMSGGPGSRGVGEARTTRDGRVAAYHGELGYSPAMASPARGQPGGCLFFYP